MPASKWQQFVAFLRGINVGGRRVSMARLCDCFVALKFCNVRSFIASGNIIFECTGGDRAALEQRIETQVATIIGFESATFLRTPIELHQITAQHPFDSDGEAESFRRHVVFVRQTLTKAQSTAVAALSNDYDRLLPKGREIHWLCRGPFHLSKIKQPALTKAIGGPWTTRNVQTVTKLTAMFNA